MKRELGARTAGKIKTLATYLEKTHGVTIDRAISMQKRKIEEVVEGKRKIPYSMVSRCAAFFGIPLSVLVDDEKELPPLDSLKMDEELISLIRDEEGEDVDTLRHKHYLALNWGLLSKKRRLKLVLSTLLITVPLIWYMCFCLYTVTKEKREKYREYRLESDENAFYNQYSASQREYHDILAATSKENWPQAFYTTVKVGTVLEKMKAIDSSGSNYEVRMQLYFKFDKDEFRETFRHYARNVLADQIINDYYVDNPGEDRGKHVDHDAWLDAHGDYFKDWIEAHDSEYYPGETSSNVLVDKHTMFDIGNGEIVADSYGTIKDLEEVQYLDKKGEVRTLCYQKVKFCARFEKAFDSARYPLDSVQFKMYITPTMDAEYVRYVPDHDVNGSGRPLSGFAPYFGLTSGYRLVRENSGIRNFVTRINYFCSPNNDPAVHYDTNIKTQYEVIVRANRQGISLFIKAFINLFSVVIWIIIAFYSQAFTGEDSIGMLGTGLFGVISSMLVGLSMVSDAGIFSLATMINIFTLAVIMIMAYQTIADKRAKITKDRTMIAYNGIKLRILFYLLTVATVVMFFILPCASYMWKL